MLRNILLLQQKKQSGKKQRGNDFGCALKCVLKKTKRKKTTRARIGGARVLKCWNFKVCMSFQILCKTLILLQTQYVNDEF